MMTSERFDEIGMHGERNFENEFLEMSFPFRSSNLGPQIFRETMVANAILDVLLIDLPRHYQ